MHAPNAAVLSPAAIGIATDPGAPTHSRALSLRIIRHEGIAMLCVAHVPAHHPTPLPTVEKVERRIDACHPAGPFCKSYQMWLVGGIDNVKCSLASLQPHGLSARRTGLLALRLPALSSAATTGAGADTPVREKRAREIPSKRRSHCGTSGKASVRGTVMQHHLQPQ